MKKLLPILLLFFCSSYCWADTTTNLAAYWKMDASSGTTVTDTEGTYNGVLHGGGWTTGEINNAVYLNAGSTVTDYIQLTPTAYTVNTTFTIAAWVYFRTPSSSTYDAIVVDYNNNAGVYLGPNSPTDLEFWDQSDGEDASGGTIPENTWTHIAVTCSSGSLVVYVNGAQVGTGTLGETGDTFAYMGNDSLGENFSGDLDEVRIYSRALSAGDIKQLYEYAGGDIFKIIGGVTKANIKAIDTFSMGTVQKYAGLNN